MALITDHREDTIEDRTTSARITGDVIEGRPTRLPPQDTRVRWGGVMSGFVVALGVLLLMGALGLAIGVAALGDPRAATSTTATGLGIGGGVWAFITLVAAVFLGSLVSTAVTDQPDRTGAVIHGVLVWVLLSLFTVWMIASGVSLGVSGLYWRRQRARPWRHDGGRGRRRRSRADAGAQGREPGDAKTG